MPTPHYKAVCEDKGNKTWKAPGKVSTLINVNCFINVYARGQQAGRKNTVSKWRNIFNSSVLQCYYKDEPTAKSNSPPVKQLKAWEKHVSSCAQEMNTPHSWTSIITPSEKLPLLVRANQGEITKRKKIHFSNLQCRGKYSEV